MDGGPPFGAGAGTSKSQPASSSTSGVAPPPIPRGHVLVEIKTQPPPPPTSASSSVRGGRRGRGGRAARSRGRGVGQEKEKPVPKQKLTVEHLWRNTDFKRMKRGPAQQFESASDVEAQAEAAEEDLDDDQDDEDMVVADTFADYKPAKLTIGKGHPDPVIETASMASVLPPNITYSLHLPEKIIDNGKLSSLQLESVTYACQQHEFDLKSGIRSGYLVGDGAGVGKGRTIAGIIYENWLQKRRKSIWISVSADLKIDSRRDLDDIGASMIKVHPLNKLKYGKISQFNEGVIFSTYSALIGHSSQGGKYNSRLKQLVKWCGKDFDGPIIFDECHRAKNLCPTGKKKPTKTGQAVHELQAQLPRARILYASATGASEPKNMAYMTRLGIWGDGTPFPDFQKFLEAIEKRGVGAMEIVAMDMKLRGAYIARQLSFKGVTFTIEKVPLDIGEIKAYDDSVELWVDALKVLQESLALVGHTMKKKQAMMIWAQFWGAHQRFFKYLCIATKVKKAVEIAKAAIKDGKCAVIGLQSTGEARTLDQLERDEGELTDFVSTAKGVFQSMVEKQFPGKIPFRSSGIGSLATGDMNTKSRPRISLIDFFDDDDDDDENDENEGPHTSRRRRGTARKAAGNTKRLKLEDDDEDDSTDVEGEESDFELDSDADASSDEALFDSDSDATLPPSMFDESDDDKDFGLGKKRKKNTKERKTAKKASMKLGKPSKTDMKFVSEMKAKLLEKIESLGERLPPNTLDELIHQLGGPNDVAEMTGRKGRVVRDRHGNVTYETRAENDVSLETVNLAEKDRFMKGDKLIAIISEAASSGISLQSDRRAKNQRRRVHITLELPWSADRAIQQFGRTHRSNQVNSPEYIFLISDLAGEHRFASVVAKRLESLGALTHGDRRATESRDLSQFHIDNKYGRLALDSVLCSILKWQRPVAPLPKDFEGDFCKDMAQALHGVELLVGGVADNLRLPKDYKNMSKFLNRILGVPVRLQNHLFQYFVDSLNAVVKQAKKTGRYDTGILDLSDNGSNEICRVRKDTFERPHATGVGVIEFHELKVERGLSWEQAMEKYSDLHGLATEGFYLSKQIRNGKQYAIIAILDSSATTGTSNVFTIYRPNTGLQYSRMPVYELREKYTKVAPEKAKAHWEQHYNISKTVCHHAYWSGNCKQKLMHYSCDFGLRQRTYHVLSGSVLLSWGLVENVLQEMSHGYIPKMQIVRVKLSTDDRIVGILIPNYCAEALREELEKGAVSSNSQGMDYDRDSDYDKRGHGFLDADTLFQMNMESNPFKVKEEPETLQVFVEEEIEETVKVKQEAETIRVIGEEDLEDTVRVKAEPETLKVKEEDSGDDSDATVWAY